MGSFFAVVAIPISLTFDMKCSKWIYMALNIWEERVRASVRTQHLVLLFTYGYRWIKYYRSSVHAMDKWITVHCPRRFIIYAVDTGTNLQCDGGIPGLNADLKLIKNRQFSGAEQKSRHTSAGSARLVHLRGPESAGLRVPHSIAIN